jgi:hypothetical protein
MSTFKCACNEGILIPLMRVAIQVVENSEQTSMFTYAGASFPSSAQKQSHTNSSEFPYRCDGCDKRVHISLKKRSACLVEAIYILAVMYLQKKIVIKKNLYLHYVEHL